MHPISQDATTLGSDAFALSPPGDPRTGAWALPTGVDAGPLADTAPTDVEETPTTPLAADALLPATGSHGVLASVRQQVQTLLAGAGKVLVERRREQRYPYPKLAVLTPLDAGGRPLPEGNVTVVGKQISEGGFGFFHPLPLPDRRMILSLEGPDRTWVSFVIDLMWCRFNRFGWYESGGRFLQSVPSPLAPPRAE